MIKLKNLLKESHVWERKFGEKLPTLADIQKKYDEKKNLSEKEEYKSILNEKTYTMGDLDLVFQGSSKVQLISRKGRTALTKQDAKIIITAVERHIGGI